MKLVLSQYLRTLRERNEFDRLLPELLTEMGYLALVKPKAGIRQYGVDFPAAGKSSKDGVDELLLFVIKQGDITRGVWSGDTDRVRESLEEVVDVYLRSHVPPDYQAHRKVVVLATTGDMAQDVQMNWAGFAARYPDVEFRFWGVDHVADLLEKHLLDEHLFDAGDRSDLRKALALAGDGDYGFTDFCRLLLRQLGMTKEGALTEAASRQDHKTLIKALRRVHLAALLCAYWADAEKDRRQALWVMERTLLWCFHRAHLQGVHTRPDVIQAIGEIWGSYLQVSNRYYEAIMAHIHTRDGLSGYAREGAEYAVTLFEQIGLLATVGISQAAVASSTSQLELQVRNARILAEALQALLNNHPATGSPRLDHQVIDICLGLFLFRLTGMKAAAEEWLTELAGRLNFVFILGRMFPVGTDSLEDMVELEQDADDDFKERMKQTSWMLATIASWCAVLGLDDSYGVLSKGHRDTYPTVGAQLWHPPHDWYKNWYFGPAHVDSGVSEAPYPLPAEAQELRNRIAMFNVSDRLQWEQHSPARALGIWALDFIACRHFRTPVPASVWYVLVRDDETTASPRPNLGLSGHG